VHPATPRPAGSRLGAPGDPRTRRQPPPGLFGARGALSLVGLYAAELGR
jgi:hypothetical protein